MEGSVKIRERNESDVKEGDTFSFVTYIEGRLVQLTGSVEMLMPSARARALGLTKSKRRRLGLLLRVEGVSRPAGTPGSGDLFYKDRGQVKLVNSTEKE